MAFKVLKSFPYAHDHKTTVTQVEGDIIDVHESVVDGLTEEGFIEEVPADPAAKKARGGPAA